MATFSNFTSPRPASVRFSLSKTHNIENKIKTFTELAKSKRMLITRRFQQARSPTIETNNDSHESSSNKLEIKSLATFPTRQSEIIDDFSVIQSFFQHKFQYQLLYRASNHNFSVKAFHDICDNAPNTLVLCKTSNSHIIGGFTPLKWKCEYEQTRTYFKSDPEFQTFLFSVTQKEKYHLKETKRNKAICCYENFGPTFGGGYDLCIGNSADVDFSSVSFFPSNFKVNRKMHSNQRKRFIGGKHENFKIKEWEVFQLKFKGKRTEQSLIKGWTDIKILNPDELTDMKKTKKVAKESVTPFLKRILHFFLQ